MRENIYTKTVSELKAPKKAVYKMLNTARNFNKKEESYHMKNYKKAVIAASLTAVIAIGGAFGISLFSHKEDNSFIMKVNAAQINEKDFTTVNNLPYTRPADNKSKVNAGFNVDFINKIEGDNIEKITYNIKGGAFIINNKYAKKLIDSKMFTVNAASNTEDSSTFYEITVPYDNQPYGNKNINNEIAFLLDSNLRSDDINGAVREFEEISTKYRNTDIEKLNVSEINEIMKKWENYCNYVLSKNCITVKVTFKNGKTETKKLDFKSKAKLDSNETSVKDKNGNWETKVIRYLTLTLKAKLV